MYSLSYHYNYNDNFGFMRRTQTFKTRKEAEHRIYGMHDLEKRLKDEYVHIILSSDKKGPLIIYRPRSWWWRLMHGYLRRS
jgi:hypothetical protein